MAKFALVLFMILSTVKASGEAALPPDIENMLKAGVSLRTKPTVNAVSGSVVPVTDARSSAVMGSATLICPEQFTGANLQRSYFLTNYHVYKMVPNGATALGARLQLEFIDSSMDLALYSLPVARPCVTLAQEINVPMTLDVDASGTVSLRNVLIEAYNSEKGEITAATMSTVLASSLFEGIPGYDLTGPVLMLNARGLRGMSGGGVFARVLNGNIDIPGREVYFEERNGVRTVPQGLLIGVIQGVDKEGRRTLAIAAPIIYQRVQAYFSNPKARGSRETTVLQGSSVLYTDLGGTYLRGPRQFQSKFEAGTARGSDGGSARGSDGSSGAMAGSQASGLVFHDQATRTWLSLPNWSEYEPLPPGVRARLRKKSREGIFEEGGRLFSSQADLILPPFLLNNKIANDDRWSLFFDATLREVTRRNNDALCRAFAALIRPVGGEVNHGALTYICESENSAGRKMSISVFPYARSSQAFTVVVNLTRACNSIPCALDYSAELYRHGPEAEALRSNNPLQWYKTWVGSLSSARSEKLSREGLRYLQGRGFEAVFELTGGFRLRLDSQVITGPVPILPMYDPMLSNRSAAKALVER